MHPRTEEMVSLNARGYSAGSISEMLGLARCTICRNLRKAGAKVRPRGQQFMISDDYVETARKMRADGKTWEFISSKIGFSVRQLQFYVNGK
jgi:hypothetical protein